MKILVYGAFKNAEKSENYIENVKKYLNNNEKNITYYIDIIKNNKSEKTKWFEMLSYLLKKNADIIVIKSVEQFSNLFDTAAGYYIEYFRQNKMKVYFLDDSIDILNDKLYMQAIIKLSFFRFMKKESDKRSIKGQRVRNEIKKEERYGYDLVENKYKVNDEEAKNIKKAYKIFLKENANKSRSEKMKRKWKDEEFREKTIRRMRMAQRNKKRMKGSEQ